jgi:hypothetical protein
VARGRSQVETVQRNLAPHLMSIGEKLLRWFAKLSRIGRHRLL